MLHARHSHELISAVVILATGGAVAQTLRVQRDDRGGGMSFRFERGDRRGDVEGKRAPAKSTHALRRFRPTQIGVSGAVSEDRLGSLMPNPTSAGADMCRAVALPKSSVAGRKNCSGASTSSATSTMTGGLGKS